jgi:hypothetical protein
MARTHSGQPVKRLLRLDALVGREVWTLEGRRFGRVGECHARHDGEHWIVEEWVIGPAGFLERLGVHARLLVGASPGQGHVARWDQLDVRDTTRVRLTCPVKELQRTAGGA